MSRLNTWNRIQLRYLQEECKRKRTCHVCNTSIPKGERHLAIHQQSTMGFWSTRQNVCFICVEELNRDMKTSVPKIKERRENRNKELFIENMLKGVLNHKQWILMTYYLILIFYLKNMLMS